MKIQRLFIQNICGDCLQSIVNGDNDRDEHESQKMDETLSKWSERKYFAYGLTENSERSFSWHTCDLCNQLPGDRYEYYFRDESK